MSQLSTAQPKPKPFCFVIMPYLPIFDDTYKSSIKIACERAELHCEREDERIHGERIIESIQNQIAKADLIVADMTGKNPNVFYEVGYAHALGKPVILITQDRNDIPFDLASYQHLSYDRQKLHELTEVLPSHLTARLGAAKSSTFDFGLRFHIGGRDIASSPTIDLPVDGLRENHLHFTVAVQNISIKTIERGTFELAIEADQQYLSSNGFRADFAFGNRRVYQIGHNQTLFPEAWEVHPLSIKPSEVRYGDVHRFLLKLLTPSGPREFPFALCTCRQTLEAKAHSAP